MKKRNSDIKNTFLPILAMNEYDKILRESQHSNNFKKILNILRKNREIFHFFNNSSSQVVCKKKDKKSFAKASMLL